VPIAPVTAEAMSDRVEVMTRVPMGSSMADGKFGYPFGPRLSARYADQGGIVPQGISAELIDLRSLWPLDFDTIADIVLHLRYTAREAGHLRQPAVEHVTSEVLSDPETLERLRALATKISDAQR